MADIIQGAGQGAAMGTGLSPGWGTVIGAGIGALGSWLGASGQQKEDKKRRQMEQQMMQAQLDAELNRRKGATRAIQGYGGYQAYSNPILSNYLAGNLSPAQQAQMDYQSRLGGQQIARRSAGMGMPSGAQAGLYNQLNRDVTLGAGQMVGQNQQLGLQYSMADWARQQEANRWKAAQLAQYAY